jgi:hypothetical protein
MTKFTLIGAILGTMLVGGAALLAGAPEWYFIALGGTFNGALFGAVIGAVVREHHDGHDTPMHPVRTICLWAAGGLCLSITLAMMQGWWVPGCAIAGTAIATVAGGLLARQRERAKPSEP